MKRAVRPPPVKTWDKDWAAVMDTIFNKGVRTKSAVEVGFKAVDYFRGIEFCEWILSHKDELHKKHPYVIKSPIHSIKYCEEIGETLIKKGFIYRAEYTPIEGMSDQDESGKPKKPPKWPKRLKFSNRQKFEEYGFYVIMYEANKVWKYTLLLMLIAIVLLLCMFPAWPLVVKVAVWYLSVILMTILLSIVVIRLVLFVLFWFVGFDFWLFPNFFNDDVGFLQTYFPFYEISRRRDDWLMYLVRFTCLLLSIVSIHQLGQKHTVSEVSSFARNSFFGVIEWGQLKLGADPNFGLNFYSNLPQLSGRNDTFINSTGEADMDIETLIPDSHCLHSCLPPNQTLKSCLLSCDCLKNVTKGACLSTCNEQIPFAISEALGNCHE